MNPAKAWEAPGLTDDLRDTLVQELIRQPEWKTLPSYFETEQLEKKSRRG